MNLYINIYGIHIKVQTKNTSLFEMIQKYYKPFLVEWLEYVDIDVLLEKESYFSSKKDIPTSNKFVTFWDTVKIDIKQERYFFSQQEISGMIDFSKETIKLEGRLLPNKLRHIVHILLQGITRIDKYYNRFLIKTCIHDIVFIFLEKKLKTSLLHATAVSNGEKTYVFAWLWGSGKSTMASAFSQMKGYTILSDNYVIMSGDKLYPFPELPRITKGTQKLLWINLSKKADGIKNYLENNLKTLQKSYKVDKVFICSYGEDFHIKELKDVGYIYELLSSINSYTKEFPEYLNLAMLSIIGKFNTNKDRGENLTQIAKSNKFFLLQSSTHLEKVINDIIHV